MRRLFSWVYRVAGLDAQVLPTLFFRCWQIVAGGVMVLFIPLWLGKVEQGYYYTFTSLLALQIFFELGMNQVIIQMVSHDFAHVSVSNGSRLKGDVARLERLDSLIGLLRRWYCTAAILFFVIVSVGGILFFSRKIDLPISSWGGAWLILTFATSVNLYLSAELTVLEGCGEVAGVARMRLVQSMWGNIFMWATLALGAGLWAMPLVPLMAVVYSGCWLGKRGKTIKLLRKYYVDNLKNSAINWRRDIFPFQWRIAVSWISGYFLFQLFTPLTFARIGAVEAGRLGITMAVFSALLTVGMSWVSAKLPAFSAHVSKNERIHLNALFNVILKRSMVFTLFAILAIVATVTLLTKLNISAIHRFASLPVVLCLAVVTLVNCFVFAAASYMRAHKEEPMMLISIVSGLATLGAAVIGSRYGVLTMMELYAAISVFVTLPWTLKVFIRYYHK